ncbi:N-acetylmuramoyl-L-alanine amidase [Staphylococcus saprophyticus]|uniref:N-acetylmuramoyl-L-alanine amidase n=1 Tax=Staphylococcus saprophyticus TaxID=29385 RepID=UPI0024C342A7|nr:N-acetylmuramoyl-L-alanine amidase [Staphylococcus saprophyticus]MDK1672927.1 N-acetylmuramoyl-L-alanine amidase [Staphylococcus saprophyticus]
MKTQKQINDRLKAYLNGTVDSPYRIRSWTSYDSDFEPMETGAIDVDGWYHAQCMDLIVDYCLWLSDNKFRIQGNAREAINNAFPVGWKVVKNEPNTVPKTGWIGVAREGTYGYEKWGHIWIVGFKSNKNTLEVIEQNWNSKANKKPQKRIDNYYGCTHFIVPPISTSNPIKKAVKALSSAVKPSNKMRVLLVAGHGKGAYSNDPGAVNTSLNINERDYLRKNIIPNIAKHLKVAGINADLYGGTKMNQDMYQDTLWGVRLGDTSRFGMYWASKQKYDAVIEFHLDAASPSATGGHTIIAQGVSSDKIDVGIQNAVKKYVGVIRGITGRGDLLNANVSKDCGVNYRLVELGFITNKTDINNINKNLNNYTKAIAEAIAGQSIGNEPATKVVTVKPKPAPKKEQTIWNWKGIFYPNTTIKVRRSPSLTGKEVDKGSWLYGKNDWVDIHSLVKDKKNKLWWAKISYPTNPKAGYFYCALGKITDKNERIKNEKALYGSIKWK